MENITEESPMDQNQTEDNPSNDKTSEETQSSSLVNQVLIFKGKTPDHSTKDQYRAKFTFHPDRPAPNWSDQSIPINNVSRKKFELECLSHQSKSREDLAKRRSHERSLRKSRLREESSQDMSTNEMFERLMDRLDERSDAIEDKLNSQEEKINNFEKNTNERFKAIEVDNAANKVSINKKFNDLEERLARVEKSKSNQVSLEDVGPEDTGEDQRSISYLQGETTGLTPNNGNPQLNGAWPSLPGPSRFRIPVFKDSSSLSQKPNSIQQTQPIIPQPQHISTSQPPLNQVFPRPAKRTREEYLKSPPKIVFKTPEEESVKAFSDSNNWVGIKVKKGEIQQFMKDNFGVQSEAEALFGAHNGKAREDWAKQKIEIFCAINVEDIVIDEHYVTSNNGVIMWLKCQDYIVREMHKMSPKIRSPDFQVKIFIPSIARDRKKYVDSLFMDFKKQKDPNFRYLVKNGTTDLEVLCKTLDNNGPYQRIDLSILGAIPKLKLVTPKSVALIQKENEDFTKVLSKKAKKLGKKVSKERLFKRIHRFINYQEPVSEDELSDDESS